MKPDWRQGILYLIIMGMDCCWLYALLILLNKQVTDGHLSIPWLLLLYPLAFIFNKLLQRLRLSKVYLYAVNGLVWAIGMLLMVKTQLYSGLGLFEPAWLLALPQALSRIIQTLEPEILLLGGSIVLWWLGWRLARLRVTFTTSVTEFQFGLAILLIVFFSASQLGVQLANSVLIALVFFLFALAGMALARSLEGAGWLTGSYQGLWSGLLLAGIGLILILGLLIGSVVTPDFLQLILIPFKWLWGMVLKAITFLASLFPEPEPVELPPALVMPEMLPPEAEEGFKMWTMPESVRSGLRLGWGVLFFGLILVALWRVSSQIFGWLRRKLTPAEAEVEPLPGAFRADLQGLLKRIMLKLLGFRLPFWRQKKLEPLSSETASIRQIYRQLLRWAASSGWPRHLSQTPHEYLHTLENLLPVAQQELRFITEQYVSVRYSPRSPTEKELYQFRRSWYQLRQNRLKGPDSEHTHQ